jgi:DNA-binding transcriptional LysR family regulator
LTAQGKELARISRFFLLGLSNFQRGCLAEGQTYRIGTSATFLSVFLLPLLARPEGVEKGERFMVEHGNGPEVERRLHELTLDFGVITQTTLSRPLQLKELRRCRLRLWVPKSLCRNGPEAARVFKIGELPLAWPVQELPLPDVEAMAAYEPVLTCATFLEARTALTTGGVAAVLPDFLDPGERADDFLKPRIPALESLALRYSLAWNPRLLRLNPHATRRRDALIAALASGCAPR